MSKAVIAAGKSLPNRFRHNANSNFSWEEAKRLGKRERICGEIRTKRDLRSVPKKILLRAVYMDDGSIRWADSSKMEQIFRGANHDYLACAGDDDLPSREGYITVKSNGDLVVSKKRTY